MDTSDRLIGFDAAGICVHCRTAEPLLARDRLAPEESARRLAEIAERIAIARNAEGYDSIVGLSGGVDSSYTAWLAFTLGLKPLAVHLDNGWDSEIAVSNIRRVAERCGLELLSLVIDWREFRDLQRAFIRAGVIDIEMVSDHAIVATMFRISRDRRIRYLLPGTNYATEHGMPRHWVWNKQDLTHIKDIHRRFGTIPLGTFPRMGLLRSVLWRLPVFGCRFIELLDVANYRRSDAVATLARETGWHDYAGKHNESIFTKFYQGYILPRKFGIDKRRVHLSALIRNAEITRDKALAILAKPPYEAAELQRDKEFVLKKLGFSETEFDRIMAEAPVAHDFYRSDRLLRQAIKAVAALIWPA